ncbi:hypothetical protein [Aestuariivivens insulae]|uniref:hypothetical protein n=1 Tax=Aestuariivivens insulae TaxID=1621988 RepID=UPI001F592110|nr:hypothetical protein [Aestuariivivens insulae]
MNKQSLIITSFIMLTLTACRFEYKIKRTVNVNQFTSEDLIGHWVKDDTSTETMDFKSSAIQKINLKKAFKAEVELLDSIGYKTVKGNWEINPNVKMGSNVAFKAELAVTYNMDEDNLQTFLFTIEQENDQITLKINGLRFEKV